MKFLFLMVSSQGSQVGNVPSMWNQVGEESLCPFPSEVVLQDLLINRAKFLDPGGFPMSPLHQL
ncbi:MAG: hypothetical protein OIF58_03700, partial [Cohaesibacter sp.]|nr:hypothetical protein [Cohaesibacter sp.]